MTVVVTGATGFVGRRLVPRLLDRGHTVVAVVRTATALDPRVRAVVAPLTDIDALASAVAGADAVLHLAATTGKAPAAVHQAVNRGGTDALVAACRRAGVPRLLFVSSIAAGFADQRGYPYAQAKREAEAVVQASGLRTLIVRPTAIFGAGSAVQRALAGLAAAPVLPVIGPGTTPLQPVHVDDVADAIADLVGEDHFTGETLDLGGPDAVPVADVLRRLRVAAGRGPGPVLRVPAGLVLVPLRLAERLGLGDVLPVSSGQFASFVQSGAARPHPWTEARRARLVTLDVMLATVAAASAIPAARPTDPPEVLARECVTFTRHLAGVAPAPPVVEAYVRAHAVSPRFAPATAFDPRLVALARRHAVLTRLADAYAVLAAPTSLLRRKLILLLALLETTPPHYRAIDAPLAGGAASTVAALAWRGSVAALVALAGVVVCLPLHLVSRGPERA